VSNPFFTIGHSTRLVAEFLALLTAAEVALVVDVRTIPRSRRNPQYNDDQLPDVLDGAGIAYQHLPELGGLRGRQSKIDPQVNGFWDNASFHNYADYALSPAFAAGLARLRKLGHAQRCAVMCAEAVWWRCHRRLVADYLITAGERVFHILGPDAVTPASLTKVARVTPDGALTYPARVSTAGGVGEAMSLN
jgi:uncharacterized protein (DUF488 family)